MGDAFGAMLRQYRLAASLTQEALAEKAAISATAIAALERGRRKAPRLSTLRQLAKALSLDGEQMAELARAASNESGSASLVREPAGVEGEDGPAYLLPPAPLEGIPVAAPATNLGALSPQSFLGTGPFAPPPALTRRWRTDFVGRRSELESLKAAWEQRHRFVLVLGEAGIGKTRLTTELACDVHSGGATVLWGRCNEERLGAYLPFVEVLRFVSGNCDPTVLATAVGDRGELTRLLPDLGEKIGPLPQPTRAEAGTEQRLLFEQVASVLSCWAPMLLVVDDLHWADDATLALLSFLALDHSLEHLVIVGTAREADLGTKEAGLLADIGRHTFMSRVRLDGLDHDALASLVTGLAGSEPEFNLVTSVASATEGNAFLAEEMIVHLVDSEVILDSDGRATLNADVSSAGVPARVKETLGRRMLSLSNEAMNLLQAGSVAGREFDLSVAAAASGLSGLELVEAADDGLLSGLLLETGPGRLSFSHALVRDALRDQLSYARRAQIHRRIAEALENRWPEDQTAAAELASHWAAVAAVDPSATTTAAAWAVRAGDVALESAAADEAIARYQEASSLWATATYGHTDALIRLGMALQYRGRADEADARFREAMHLAAALHDPRLQARAAIGFGRRYPYWETDQDRLRALESCLGDLSGQPEADEPLRLTIMGLIVTQVINGFHPEEAERRDQLCAHLARVADDPSTADDVLLSIGRTRLYDFFEDPVALDRVALRLVNVAEGRSDLRVAAVGRFSQALAAIDQGNMELLDRAVDGYRQVAERLDDPRERSQAATARATIAFIEGRYADSADLSEEAVKLGRESGDFNADLVYYAQGLLRAVDQGQASDVLPLLLASDEYKQIASFNAGTALCAALAGEDDLAQNILDGMLRNGFDGSPRGADRLSSTAFLAHACCVIGSSSHAGELVAALGQQPCGVVRVGPLIGWWGPVDHHMGSLSRLVGRFDEAEQRLRSAIETSSRMGAKAFEARSRAELAFALAEKGTGASNDVRGDRAYAKDEIDRLLTEALQITDSLGASGVQEEVVRAREAVRAIG